MDPAAALGSVRALFDAAVDAVDAWRAVVLALEARADVLARAERVRVVAAGKAAVAMARGAEQALGARVAAGLAVTKRGHAVGAPLRVVCVREAGHPTPDEDGVRAADAVCALIADGRPEDTLVCLLSGGASALLTSPADGITLEALRATTAAMLRAGAPIHELNAVRKHLERLKGGGLAALAQPARVLALIVSDVPGDALDVIASGPTVGDTSTFAEALAVLERRCAPSELPAAVWARLRAGARGELRETPRVADPLFARVENVRVASLARAAHGAARRANELGFSSEFFALTAQGEARDVGRELAARGLARRARMAPGERVVLIGGGESTVTVRGAGRGGRNCEVALAAAIALAGHAGVAVASLATDGDDGPSGAAGAVATGASVAQGRAAGCDAHEALVQNDSAGFFARAGGLLVTGPTQTNVADLFCVLLERGP